MEHSKCRTCGWVHPMQPVCQRTGLQVDLDTDYCSKHSTDLHICELCGHPVAAPILDMDGDKVHIICQNCNSAFGTCQLCGNSINCLFETDPSPIPKLIQKTIRQGPMTTVTQVVNPERVEQTCKKGCNCFSDEFGCARQFNTCANHNFNWGMISPRGSHNNQ